mmetsp:Transcript_26303/g.80892  ORF Transcript_26303/g.80892 Transcript_26303/m.80892 type:complete len:154 (+) Transcript_26303:87-548(+)
MDCCGGSGAVQSQYEQIFHLLRSMSRDTVRPLGQKLLGRQHMRCALCDAVDPVWVIDYFFEYDLVQLEVGFPCPMCEEKNEDFRWQTSVGIGYDTEDNSIQVVRRIWHATSQTPAVKVVHPWVTGRGVERYVYDGSERPHPEPYYEQDQRDSV